MPEAVIAYAGAMPYDSGGAVGLHPFTPCLTVSVGSEQLFRVHTMLSWEGSINAKQQLVGQGISSAEAEGVVSRALLMYAIERLDLLAKDWLSNGSKPENPGDVWELTTNDVPRLLALVQRKTCAFRLVEGRNLFCTATAIRDPSISREISSQRVAPTSTPLCNACKLPDDRILCSSLIHPQVSGAVVAGRGYVRTLEGALCDRGQRDNIMKPDRCYASGHNCWQRVIEVESPVAPPVSPLELAEAWDVLDAVWRLVFGKNKRLLSISSALVPASISLECATRVEFASRVGALADLIDRVKIGEDLLPPGVKKQDTKGSIDAMERVLLHKLPTGHHQAIKEAISTLHRVRDVRNTMAHNSSRDGGLTAKLHGLGIHDAPPHWGRAWDAIRAHTAGALAAIRYELQRFDENTAGA